MPDRRVSWKNIVLIAATLSALVLLVLESPLGMSDETRIGAVILITAATLWITEVVPLFVTSFVVLLLCSRAGRFRTAGSGELGAGREREWNLQLRPNVVPTHRPVGSSESMPFATHW